MLKEKYLFTGLKHGPTFQWMRKQIFMGLKVEPWWWLNK